MKRIYQNNDLTLDLDVINFPINRDLIQSLEFKFYTRNVENCIIKNENDVNEHNQVILEWNELKNLESGVLFYRYNLKLVDSSMSDATRDRVNVIVTQYYIVTDTIPSTQVNGFYTKEDVDKLFNDAQESLDALYYSKTEVNELIDEVTTEGEVNLQNYYTKAQSDTLLNSKSDTGHTHSQYLTEHQSLTNYYNKSEVNELIDGVTSGEVDLTNYYNKSEVDSKLTNKSDTGHTHSQYLTEHQSLENYYNKTEVDAKIDEVTSGDINLQNYYDKSEVDSKLTNKSDTGHTHSQYLTEHQSLENYYVKSEIDAKIDEVTSGEVNLQNYYDKTETNALLASKSDTGHTHSQYLTEHQDLSAYAKLSDIPTIWTGTQAQYDALGTYDNNITYYIIEE